MKDRPLSWARSALALVMSFALLPFLPRSRPASTGFAAVGLHILAEWDKPLPAERPGKSGRGVGMYSSTGDAYHTTMDISSANTGSDGSVNEYEGQQADCRFEGARCRAGTLRCSADRFDGRPWDDGIGITPDSKRDYGVGAQVTAPPQHAGWDLLSVGYVLLDTYPRAGTLSALHQGARRFAGSTPAVRKRNCTDREGGPPTAIESSCVVAPRLLGAVYHATRRRQAGILGPRGVGVATSRSSGNIACSPGGQERQIRVWFQAVDGSHFVPVQEHLQVFGFLRVLRRRKA